MRAADIELLTELSRPAVSADASFAVVAAAHPSIDANRQLSRLWRVDLADGTRRPLTQGTGDTAPVLTGDSSHVLFLRSVDGKPQVHALPLSGGEAMQLSFVKHGVAGFKVSPDETRLALQVQVPEQGRGGSVEGLSAEAQSPRHITTLRYHGNGVGYTGDAYAHIFVQAIDLEASLLAEPPVESASRPDGSKDDPADRDISVQLTRGSSDFGLSGWSSSGVLAVTRLHDERDSDLRTSLVLLDPDAAGAEPKTLVGVDQNLSIHEAVEADGSLWLLAGSVGDSGRDFVAQSTNVYVVDGTSAALLTDPDTHDFGDPGSHLTAVADGVLAMRRSRGRVQLVHVTRASVTDLTSSDQEITGVATGDDQIVAVAQTATSFGEVGTVANGSWRALTDFGSALAASGIVAPIEHEITTRDGSTVHGWVWIPEGGGKHPVLLNIHGGPFAQYGVHVFDEAQVAVANGYAVVQCNPRGSAGYGREHGVAIKEAMGTVDFTDVIDFLEGVVAEHPELDAERMGVMGGSYGGYLTAWTIAHDHRFTAAVVERGYLDPLTFIGTSDIGTFFSEEYTGYDTEHALTQSPMAHVDQVRTPTLVVHSELDFRCPLEQAQRYYIGLRRAGVDAEMLVFPGENHELTRGGQPRHRLERFQHLEAWWRRWLPVAD